MGIAGESHHEGHGHAHLGHAPPGGPDNRRRLSITLILVLVYMVAEVIGGLLTNSLALLADAGHMLGDAAALALALFAIWFAGRPASSRHTFGYHRTEILAALANGAALVAVAGIVCVEAVQRLGDPPPVEGGLMTGVAAGGFVINLAGLWILHGGRKDNLNVRGAWLHVFTDMLGSVQAVVAGVLIVRFGWTWADPLASILISGLVVYSAWALLRASVAVLMLSAPLHVDVDELHDAIVSLDGVAGVCDLHVWTITSGMHSMSAHVVVEDGRGDRDMLRRVRQLVHERFGIDHVTIQLEPEAFEEPALRF
ncbi:MAG: cation diffusion facilitator family transporter [Gemmatimonadota bacterium]|nr:cation diffusion facilitator family transporter [Gemmatimonadota bacterium]MDH3427135.1 cation diffusion facilitator family transporter [Gemmatimonadota bacterium]